MCLPKQALRHEGEWGSGCIDPNFLDLGTSPDRLTPGERPPVPIG
jgi:hypothetical protein